MGIEPSDAYKTAFVTHRGLYEWLTLPFGILTASSAFQRVMDDTLRPHSDYSCAYIDDSACFSLGWNDHMCHLDNVFTAFEDINMSLKFAKCKFARSQTKFIGHVVGSGSRSPALDKVEAIRLLPEPTTKKLVRGFLGMVSFFRAYIPNFSYIALPLTDLTKDCAPNKITLNDTQRTAFCTLKDKLCNYTLLYAIDFNKCFHLFTDSSDVAVGVALTQVRDSDDTHLPVAFASSKLTPTQCRWSTIEREAYGVVFGLRKFEHIIYAKEVNIWSDHDPLSFLTTSMPQSSKLIRWSLCLSKFNYTLRHISGSANKVADYLSRAPFSTV